MNNIIISMNRKSKYENTLLLNQYKNYTPHQT